MPYAAGRIFHDADSHVMEPADWLVAFAEDAMKDRLLRPAMVGVAKAG